MKFTGSDGETVISNGSDEGNEFVLLYAQAHKTWEERKQVWINELRANFVAAAHPDDGWVRRDKNTVLFAYPYFNDGAKVGSMIVLGDPDEYRIVKVIKIFTNPVGVNYRFVDCPLF